MAKDTSCGLMGEYTKVTGLRIKSKAKVSTSGQMDKPMMVNSKTMTATALANFIILTVKDSKATGEKEKNTAVAFTPFLMEANTT